MTFQIAEMPCEVFTRRSLLADSARSFDPLGWLSPVTIRLKRFLQLSYVNGTGWDDTLPDSIVKEWSEWREHFNILENIKLPRLASRETLINLQLHIFCDASEIAYAACIYLRGEDMRGVSRSL